MSARKLDHRFSNLSFDDFRRMARDESLSRYEKIGFPDSYRKGKERLIFDDIVRKLSLLQARNKTVLDIGPGCSELPLMLIDLCRRRRHKLLLVDSEEMLSHLPERPFIVKIPGFYPDCAGLLDPYRGAIDVILSYSVLHYVFAASGIWEFLDTSLALLAHGGEMLIGDIPNLSKRRRFFRSPAGKRFHEKVTGSPRLSRALCNGSERRSMDDSVLLKMLARARRGGFDAYLLPQPDDLPMANRREDIVIRRP